MIPPHGTTGPHPLYPLWPPLYTLWPRFCIRYGPHCIRYGPNCIRYGPQLYPLWYPGTLHRCRVLRDLYPLWPTAISVMAHSYIRYGAHCIRYGPNCIRYGTKQGQTQSPHYNSGLSGFRFRFWVLVGFGETIRDAGVRLERLPTYRIWAYFVGCARKPAHRRQTLSTRALAWRVRWGVG